MASAAESGRDEMAAAIGQDAGSARLDTLATGDRSAGEACFVQRGGPKQMAHAPLRVHDGRRRKEVAAGGGQLGRRTTRKTRTKREKREEEMQNKGEPEER